MLLHKNVNETLLIQKWEERDFQGPQSEQSILDWWHLAKPANPISNKPNLSPEDLDCWSAPPLNFTKLNYDGASKGNPGPAGIRGAFRNLHGDVIRTFRDSIRWERNNMVEMEALM